MSPFAVGQDWDKSPGHQMGASSQVFETVGDARRTRTFDLLLRRKLSTNSKERPKTLIQGTFRGETSFFPTTDIPRLSDIFRRDLDKAGTGLGRTQSFGRHVFESVPGPHPCDLSQSYHILNHIRNKHLEGATMARINIEDSLFKDRRYQAFMLKIGDPTLALGAFCEACIIAQEFYLNEQTEGRVPIEAWRGRGIREEIISSGLAELSEGFVKLRGSDEQFAWLRRAQKAGEASGEARQRKSTDVQRKLTQVNASEAPTLTLTLSPTLPLSSISSSDSFSGKQKAPVPAAPEKTGQILVGIYCDAWKEKYQTRPDIVPKDSTALKRLAKDLGVERAQVLVRAFLRMNDQWFITKRHDVATLIANLNAVTQFADTNRMFTKSEIQSVDRTNTNLQTLEALRAGKL